MTQPRDPRQEIVKEILDLKVESGKPLRQVKVSEETYFRAKKFVLKARNVLEDGSYYRFKILYEMPSGTSIYDVLMNDAGSTPLGKAMDKISEWRDAGKSLVRYTLNLLLAPNRPEFQRLKLSSSYYVYQVSKKLKGAEEILQAMGYEKVGGSSSQELKYSGDVDSQKMAETAADLVILDGELQRIGDLVKYLLSSHIQTTLSRVLEVRSHPSQVYTDAKFTLDPSIQKEDGGQQHSQAVPPQQKHPRPTTIEPPLFQHDTQCGPPRPQQEPRNPNPHNVNHDHFQQQICESSKQSSSYDRMPPLEYAGPEKATLQTNDSYNFNSGQFHNEEGNIHTYANTPKKSNARDGDYEVIPSSALFSPPDPNNFPEPIVQSQSELERMNLVQREVEMSSMIDARSEGVGYDDRYMHSMSSTPITPHNNSAFNKQAEDAWKIETPTHHTPSDRTSSEEHKSLRQEHDTNPGTIDNGPFQDSNSTYGDTVNNDKPTNEAEADNMAVPDEWWTEAASGYDNQDNFGQPKDYKKYDKPIAETKEKMPLTSEQLPNLPTLDPPPHGTGLDNDETWRRNMANFENTPHGCKPTAKPRKLGTDKALTSPFLPDSLSSETTSKPHTSPLSSLEQRERENSLQSNPDDFVKITKDQLETDNTTPSLGRESNTSEDYENVSLNPSTHQYDSTIFKFNLTEEPSSLDSLRPTSRRRSQAMSEGCSKASSRLSKGAPSQNYSSDEPSSVTKPEFSEKVYLGSMRSGVESRERSNTRTDLDHGTRTSEHSGNVTSHVSILSTEECSSPHTSLNQGVKNIVFPAAAVHGTWTCEYCTNIMFEGNVCDVCSHTKPVGTLV